MKTTTKKSSAPSDGELFWNLKRYGSPLSRRGEPGVPLSVEQTLVFSLGLARRYPPVAQVWPVVFERHRTKLDLELLESLATGLGHERSLGFFLSVTRALTLDASLVHYEKRLHEKTYPMEHFFLMGQGNLYRELSKKRTPPVAKKWGFWMNTTPEDFKSCFHKFVERYEPVCQ